jgi:translation initiation factor 5B
MKSTLKASQKKKGGKKDKKKKKDADVSFADGPPPGEGSDTEAANAKGDITAPKKPAEIDPDDLLDEEFGPTKTKPKKGNKGKKAAKDEDDEDDEAPEPSGSMCIRFSDAYMLTTHATSTSHSPSTRGQGESCSCRRC